jgi:hypothetical protein
VGHNYCSIPTGQKLNSISGAITIELWIKSSFGATQLLLARRTNTAFSYGITFDSTFVRFSVNDDNIVPVSSVVNITSITPADNLWHHIAATYDGKGNTSMFFDAKQTNGTPVPGMGKVNNIGNLYIGSDGYGNDFSGYIDEVRVYDKAISSAEVQQHYAEGIYKIQLAELTNNSLLK